MKILLYLILSFILVYCTLLLLLLLLFNKVTFVLPHFYSVSCLRCLSFVHNFNTWILVHLVIMKLIFSFYFDVFCPIYLVVLDRCKSNTFVTFISLPFPIWKIGHWFLPNITILLYFVSFVDPIFMTSILLVFPQ